MRKPVKSMMGSKNKILVLGSSENIFTANANTFVTLIELEDKTPQKKLNSA